jgi:hypothetical protein
MMLTITKNQFNQIEQEYRQRRRQQLLVDFTKKYPNFCFEMTDQRLIEHIDLVISEGKELDITKDADILDCLAIGLFLKKTICNNEVVALVLRTINNQAWVARKRLDFILTQILPPNFVD